MFRRAEEALKAKGVGMAAHKGVFVEAYGWGMVKACIQWMVVGAGVKAEVAVGVGRAVRVKEKPPMIGDHLPSLACLSSD